MKTLTIKIQFADWIENQIEETKNMIEVYKDGGLPFSEHDAQITLRVLECTKSEFEKALIK